MIEGLQRRVMTAVLLLLGLVAVTTLAAPFYFALLLAIAVLVASWEWAGLSGRHARWARIRYQAIMAASLSAAFFLLAVRPDVATVNLLAATVLLLGGLLWWILAFFMLRGYPHNTVHWAARSRIGLMGILTLVPAWVGMVMLKYLAPGGYLLIALVLLVAAVDVGSYFAGHYLGKRKLAPGLSPNKSWEGVWGGVASCVLVGLLLIWCYSRYVSPLDHWQLLVLLVLCPVMAVLAVTGDLVESMLKRHCRLKDSGQLLPGHGGLLDRVDGLVAVTPAYVLTLLLALGSAEPSALSGFAWE